MSIPYSTRGFLDHNMERRFWKSLNETIAFCKGGELIDNPAASLRRLKDKASDYGDLELRESRVLSVSHARSDILATRGEKEIADKFEGLGGGQLIAYFPDMDLFDGAAAHETDGYFDVHNTPPHDTWVDMVLGVSSDVMGDFLISWVPPQLFKLADEGIEVNPEQCIIWLQNVDHPLVAFLISRGVFSSKPAAS